jgi:hypothetical protein
MLGVPQDTAVAGLEFLDLYTSFEIKFNIGFEVSVKCLHQGEFEVGLVLTLEQRDEFARKQYEQFGGTHG